MVKGAARAADESVTRDKEQRERQQTTTLHVGSEQGRRLDAQRPRPRQRRRRLGVREPAPRVARKVHGLRVRVPRVARQPAEGGALPAPFHGVALLDDRGGADRDDDL